MSLPQHLWFGKLYETIFKKISIIFLNSESLLVPPILQITFLLFCYSPKEVFNIYLSRAVYILIKSFNYKDMKQRDKVKLII